MSKQKFADAILMPKKGNIAIIAEIKFASPTEPHLADRADLIRRAKEYEQAGADAISLIAQKNIFKGDMADVAKVKNVTALPILLKDFVISEKQIYQTKKAGADAILLIAKIVSKEKLKRFVKLAKSVSLEPVVEINDKDDLKKAMGTETSLVAVNARNFDTLAVDVNAACGLLNKVPPAFLKLGFSGVNGKLEVDKYRKAGAKGVLVGTSLMKAQNIKEFIGGLRG